MSSRFKKVALAIYLDPAQDGPDSFAYNTMVGWAQKRKEYASDPNASLELHQLMHIHKPIYLSGLYLHSLKPELAESLALSLTDDSINEESLIRVLRTHNIGELEAASLNTEELLSGISDTLRGVLDSERPIATRTAKDHPVTQGAEASFVESLETLALKQMREIEELKKSLHQQNKLLQQLIANSVKQNTCELDKVQLDEQNLDSAEQVQRRLNNVRKVRSKSVF